MSAFIPEKGTDFLMWAMGGTLPDGSGDGGSSPALSNYTFDYTNGDLTEVTHVLSGLTYDFTYTSGDLTQVVDNVKSIIYDFSYTDGDLATVSSTAF